MRCRPRRARRPLALAALTTLYAHGVAPHEARAQSAAARPDPRPTAASTAPSPTERSRAFVVAGGPMIGVLGGGVYARVAPEFQLHRARRFEGHALGLGLAMVWWPNEGGPSFSFAARYQFDHQLVSGTPFFVSPYVGLDAGLGLFDLTGEDRPVRFAFIATPTAGLDVKLLLGERFVLGFRPIGLALPIFFGGPVVTADLVYDIAITLGARYGS